MKRSILAFSLAMAASPLALLACGEEAPAPKNPTSVTVTPPASSSVAATPSAAPSPSVTTPPPPPPPAPVVNDVPNSEDPKAAPTVKITAPALNASIDPKKAADFVVKLDVKNWDLKEGKHVHLISGAIKGEDDEVKPFRLRKHEAVGQGARHGDRRDLRLERHAQQALRHRVALDDEQMGLFDA